tara:strand:- start:1913 stop:2371 length:459 start_codon:yes stop_codon:yes gene_type:complete
MSNITWSDVCNKENECAEFSAVHTDFAWRKHYSSKFGQIKSSTKKCADNSLSRAFATNEDSIHQLFSPNGNRTLKDHPEYGLPKFAMVWYSSEPWAILCTSNEAVLIPTVEISSYKRVKEGAHDRIQRMQRLWDASETALKIPLSQVAGHVA